MIKRLHIRLLLLFLLWSSFANVGWGLPHRNMMVGQPIRLRSGQVPPYLLLNSYVSADSATINDVSREATRLEAELGKYKATSARAADTMAALVDLYYKNGRIFGLIRVAQKFVAAHPADSRHKDIMLKLIDGLQVTSRNEDLIAACRQFLTRYPSAPQCAEIEVRLARILHLAKDRVATADAYRAIWRRRPTTETGRSAGVTACELYAAAGGKNVTTGAELAQEMFEHLKAGDFKRHVGFWAFEQWRRVSQWAKSNVVGNKLLKMDHSDDNEALWRLNRDMADSYGRQKQHANAVLSLNRCRKIRDDDPAVHYQLIEQMFHAGAKPGELEPVVSRYVQTYTNRPDRYNRQILLAQSYLRSDDKTKGLDLLRKLLGFEAYYYSSASAFVRTNGNEPAQLAETERVLKSAIEKDSKDVWYLRYVLGFELYRDRMKDPVKARRVLRDFISQSPTDNDYSRNVITWLLNNAPDEDQFGSDVALIIEARKENIHMENLRGYLAAWAQQTKRNTKKSGEQRKRANYVTQELALANKDPIVSLWLKFRGNRRNRPDAGLQQRILAPATFNRLNDTLARTLLWDLANYYRNQSSTKRRPESVPIWARLAERFPKDYTAAVEYLRAATDYGSAQDAAKAARHILTFEPGDKGNADTWRRLLVAADKGKDDALAKKAYSWIMRSQRQSGLDPGYASGIGDILARRGMEQQALDYWTTYCSYDRAHSESRECAWRVMSKMETSDERISFLQQMIEPDTDYFGRYALWLGREYYAMGDIDGFEKVMRKSLARRRRRPFRGWDMSQRDLYDLVVNCRGRKEISDRDKGRVFAVARDMELDWASSVASLALLEITAQDSKSPIKRLLDYQVTTQILGGGSWQWDQLMTYVQALLAEDDHMAAATLITGMLANIDNVDARRTDAGRKLVAQSYSRIGAVGLTIDEDSPIALLLHAALYLRLGDKAQALETYQANRKLFDKNRDEVPIDLLIFVCDSHIAAGGDENHERAEEILRGWIVKNSESKQFDDNVKAEIQLLLAKNFFKARRYDLARSEYITVINRYPDTAQALEAEFGVGETFMAQKVYDQAELIFEELANRRQADVIVRAEFLRGVLAYRRGDRDEARDIFRTVLERVPDIDLANQALFHLAEVYGDQERYIDQLNLLRTVGRLGRRSKRWHAPGIALSIVVQDSDLGISRGHNRIPVIVTTEPGGDSETIYLVSGGAGKGLFRADLETQLGRVRQNDRVLQLGGLDVLRCDYPDEFKQEFRRVPLSDVDIHIAADAEFDVASSKIVDEEDEGFSKQLEREENEQQEELRVSQLRPSNQIKPGNLIYIRVKDADRDLSDETDRVVVKLAAESGDEVQVALTETGPHDGVFEGSARTGELPAGALATDSAIEYGPLMAIDRDPNTYWLSEPDGATPKTLTVDMKELNRVSRIRISTPAAERNAPVRGDIYGSNDGRFWFRLASNPARPAAEPVAGKYGQMTRRVYSGYYTRFTNWTQVVALSRNTQPIDEGPADELNWMRAEEDEKAKRPFAVLWHGKLVQEREGAARINVQGELTAATIDGRLELEVGPGSRTVDVWLERGTHDLTVFCAESRSAKAVGATFARASHDAADVVMMPFRAADFDLQQPLAQPAEAREPVKAEFGETQWTLQIPPQELRYVRLVVEEYIGEAVAIDNFEIGGETPGEIYIPTDADVLSLATNDILEIAGGDVVTASYTDEFTQRESAAGRLLTAELTATYFDADVAPIAYDFVRQKNGAVTEVRKQLMRIEPGERIIAEIVDYDRDETTQRDTVQFEVYVNDGEPVELTATETEEYSGTFTKEIDTAAEADPNLLTVKRGDRIYLRYQDSQNTFPGHAVPRETVVYVNTPTEGQIRILESRFIPADPEEKIKQQFIYEIPAEGADVSRVAPEAPLTVEVIDPDAARDSNSEIIVKLATTDGDMLDVACVVSGALDKNVPAGSRESSDLLALEQGRFIGQVVMQLGGKDSPDLVPVTAGTPRNLVGGPKVEEESESETDLDEKLVTRVLNATGRDQITATYSDEFRPDANAVDLAARARLVANGQLIVTDRDYRQYISKLHVGEKMFLLVADADRDSSDRRDTVTVEIASESGEKEIVPLTETLAHSGVFTGSLTLKAAQKPTPGNLQIDEPQIECYFGDMLYLKYVDTAAGTESGELELSSAVPVVVGTDGLVTAFSKTFDDEALAVETKFRIAESYFELFKSHKDLQRTQEQASDLEAGRRILHEIMEDYPERKYVPRTAYLLGQFAQELEHWDEAVESYEVITRQYQEHPLASDAQYKLAQTHEESGDFDAALEAYVTLAATYPKSPLIPNVMIRICDHFYKKENYEVAAQVGAKFLEKYEAHQYAPRLAFRQGQCYYKSENYTEAAAAFDLFAKRFPDDPLGADALFWAGESYRMARKNTEAFQRYNRCRWDFPASEAAKYARGRLALPEMLRQFEQEAEQLQNE